MSKILSFGSCVNEFKSFGIQTPTSYEYIAIANAATKIPAYYANDSELAGKVTGIGYGWQKYIIPSSGKLKFTVRGGAGGSTGKAGYTINATTGAVSGSGNRPGRGAKLQGEGTFQKGDILYLLVGFRGWCNNGSDYGGGGGGASVVLRDNPAGAYTFAPLNRKVDVLFVAGGGGGCYDSSFGTQYYGVDAVTSNGTNTNGGGHAQSSTSGGAGLTGNGATGSRGTAYNLLSGTPHNGITSNFGQVKYGTWGGGGAPWNGGGGGGGYSGGYAIDGGLSQGGTSYINLTFITETYRGYANITDDANRNCSNPWSAYGHIEIELGRDENKLILAKDNDGYKYFDGQDNVDGTSNSGATNQWKPLPTQVMPEQQTYLDYGKAIITNTIGLLTDVKFLIMSKQDKELLNISGQANKALIKQTAVQSLSDVSLIKSITFTGNLSNLDIRFAVSKDSGANWVAYNAGTWNPIDINDKDLMAASGYPLDQISTIPIEDWNSLKAPTINFAFLVTQNGASTQTIIDNITITADLVGSWRHFKESEASYEYISDNEAKVTFLEAGNYKVNYLDSLNPGTTS